MVLCMSCVTVLVYARDICMGPLGIVLCSAVAGMAMHALSSKEY